MICPECASTTATRFCNEECQAWYLHPDCDNPSRCWLDDDHRPVFGPHPDDSPVVDLVWFENASIPYTPYRPVLGQLSLFDLAA